MSPANLSLLSAALLAVAPAVVLGQAPAQGRPRGPMAPVRSPEVRKDTRVTFRFRAPNARNVVVARDGAPPAAMQKDDQGV
jgi:hypothetical protein